MNKTTFAELGLIEPLLRALSGEKYEFPTPIQAEAIPHLLAGKDLLGAAQTGTGKTAAFSLPILQRLSAGKISGKRNSPRALILAPTRELANQVCESFKTYSRYLKITCAAVYGGVPMYSQIKALSRNVDVLVATPGRLLDLMNQRHIFLDCLEVFTLDEADRMLDMGFIDDIKKIIAKIPDNRQTMFFSATMPGEASQLAARLLKDPIHIKVNPISSTAVKVEQKVLFVDRQDKEALLFSILEDAAINRALIFTRTKHKANNIAQKLNKNMVKAEAIHGNKSQSARMQALRKFSNGQVRVLVATDVASRGIDVKDISHVINFEMPNEPENYVHRIGRTARAGASGIAISFCDSEERGFLGSIERITKSILPVDESHAWHSPAAAASRIKAEFNRRPAKRGNFRPRRNYGHQRAAR